MNKKYWYEREDDVRIVDPISEVEQDRERISIYAEFALGTCKECGGDCRFHQETSATVQVAA